MARTALATNAYRPDAVRDGTAISLDVVYSGALALDAYKPPVAGCPSLIVIHGGGWQVGDKADLTNGRAIARWFAERGFAAFSINHTLVTVGNATAPQSTTFRQQLITEVLAAVSWVRANAATYNGLTSKIAILGQSSGAHLALMAGIQGVAGASRPDAVVAWSGVTRLDQWNGIGYPTSLAYVDDYIGGATSVAANATAARSFSPYNQITANCPPIRIVNSASEADPGVPQSQADDMHTAALAAGVQSTKRILTGTVHADFRGLDDAAAAAWLRSVLNWPPVSSRVAATRSAVSAARAAA